MSGIFLLRKGVILSFFVVPLLLGTLFWTFFTAKTFEPLSRNVNLSSVCEVQRGVIVEDVQRMRDYHPATASQRQAYDIVSVKFAILIDLQKLESTEICAE